MAGYSLPPFSIAQSGLDDNCFFKETGDGSLSLLRFQMRRPYPGRGYGLLVRKEVMMIFYAV